MSDLKTFHAGGELVEPPQSEWRRGDGLTMKPIPSAIDALAAMIHSDLGGSGSTDICVLENAVASPGDPFLAKLTSRVVIHDGEVYHVVAASESAVETVRQTIREAQSIPTFVGVLTSADASLTTSLHRGEFSSADQLSGLARRAQTLFVGAYDGESYVVWRAGGRQR